MSLLDYNAACDGVWDDAPAFARAIAALPAVGGEIVIPAGCKPLIASTVVVNKRLTLRGTGSSETNTDGPVTVLKAASLSGPAFRLTAPCAAITSLTLRGQTGNAGDGIVLEAGRCSLEDVSVYGMGQDGIRIGTDSGTNANLWFLKNIRAKNNGRDGLALSDKVSTSLGLADANGGTLIHADLQYNGRNGLRITNAQLNTLIGVVCQSNASRGMEVESGGRNNTFVGGDWEGNGATAVYFESGSFGNTMLGGTIQGGLGDDGKNTFIGTQIYVGTTLIGIFNKLANVDHTAGTSSLNWYEQGSFTPTAYGSTATGTPVYAAQQGRFTRTGDVVTGWLRVGVSSHAGATGTLTIGGLPWPANASGQVQVVNVLPNRLIFSGAPAASISPGSAAITLTAVSSGANAAGIAAASNNTNYDIEVSFSYKV